MVDFTKLKNRRQNSLDKLVKAAENSLGNKTENRDPYNDDRFWKPTIDKAENGYAVIRFVWLPPDTPDANQLGWVQYWDHGFKGPTGRWYIERSLTTIGQPDPVSELNSELWNSGREEDKQTARDRKRRLHYISNIYVVKDPGNPENEGKVFLFKYGKRIFNKIMDVMQPQFQDETPINPFDFWEGADFKLKIRKVEGYRNYDKSEFSEPSPLLSGDDERLENEVFKKLYDINEFVDPKNFKSYDELKKRLNNVLGITTTSKLTTKQEVALDEVKEYPTSLEENDIPETLSTSTSDEDEDTLAYFAKLAAED